MFRAYEQGVLRVAVRRDLWREKAAAILGEVELGRYLPAFTRLSIDVDGQGGRTGKEARSEAEEVARAGARAAAAASPALARILRMVAGELESVEPVAGVEVVEEGALEARPGFPGEAQELSRGADP